MSIDTLRTILYAESAVVGLLVIYSAIRQKGQLAQYFFFVVLCTFFYVFGYASELGADSLADVRFWLTFEYFGLSFISSFWFLLSWKLWHHRVPRFRMKVLLFVVPAVTLFLVASQEYQSLYYKSLNLIEVDGHYLVILDKGPWYWVYTGYQLLLIALSFFLQFRAWLRQGRSYLTDSFWMLLGTLNLVPWIGAYQLGLSPYNIDLGPFGIAVSTFFIAIAVFRFGALGSEEVLLYSIFASIDDGVLVLDRDGRISGFNAAAQKIFLWLDTNFIGKPVSSTSDAALFGSAKNQNIEKVVELSNSRRYYEGKVTQIYEGRLQLGKIYIFRDITQSRLLMRRLRKLANFDVLTGLYNRRRFMEQAEKELARAQRRQTAISMLMIDVDHFKTVNDQFGHVIGDRVLSAVGRVIKRRGRGFGFAGRYGGEEFVVFLRNTQNQQAKEIAEGIRQGIEGIAMEERMISIKVTVSIGLSCCEAGECGHNVDTLLVAADRALYQAKNRGRNRVES
ncbi:MAG TPA: hypothetical protein DDZ37_03225 [Spirochaetaceae bacterium]|nr:hypothetical protein [Spirochaetaceae bacterium]